MGAEAAVAHADAVLGAEPGGDQRVGHALDDEGRDRQRLGSPRGAEQPDAVDRRAARRGARPAMASSWARMAAQPIARQLVDGGVEGDRAEHVGRARLLALGRVGPHHLVEVDEVDGAAAGQERVAAREGRPRADEHARAEGRVHLVAAPGDEVGLGGQRPVRSELGGVDEHRHAPVVGGGDDGVERREPAGDVRGAGDGEQPRPGRASSMATTSSTPKVPSEPHSTWRQRRQARPRQEVGVVLDDRRDDDVVAARGGDGTRGG